MFTYLHNRNPGEFAQDYEPVRKQRDLINVLKMKYNTNNDNHNVKCVQYFTEKVLFWIYCFTKQGKVGKT